MPLTPFVVLLLLVGAVLIRLGAKHERLVHWLKIGIPLLGLGLLAYEILSVPTIISGRIWLGDSLVRVAALVACVVPLVIGCLETRPDLLALMFWSSGLLALCASSPLSLVQWAAMQFAILPTLFFGRTRPSFSAEVISRHPTQVLGSGLFTTGFFLLQTTDVEHPAATISLILMICGLGGMLGWFPFPRVSTAEDEDISPGAIFGKRFLPVAIAGTFLFRMVERQPLTSYQSTILAVAAMFSLGLCSARMIKEERLSRRLVLSSLSVLSCLLFAVCLRNWEAGHLRRIWEVSSNLPGASSLFVSILACETAGLLALTCGFQLLNVEREGADFVQTLAGAASKRPWTASCSLVGLLTLSGLPPLPGFWWRWGLITACFLPHRQSNVTQVMEADYTFALLALLMTLLLISSSLGQLRLLQQMLLDEPFRLRSDHSPRATRIATVLTLLLLAGAACVPFSLSQLLNRPNTNHPGIIHPGIIHPGINHPGINRPGTISSASQNPALTSRP